MVGSVPVGGDAPITVQTMTNTLTTDVSGTIKQIKACAEAAVNAVSLPEKNADSTNRNKIATMVVQNARSKSVRARSIGRRVLYFKWLSNAYSAE